MKTMNGVDGGWMLKNERRKGSRSGSEIPTAVGSCLNGV